MQQDTPSPSFDIMTTQPLHIRYLLDGDDRHDLIIIPPGHSISELRKRIYKDATQSLATTDSKDLTLLKVSNSLCLIHISTR
jgi:hypothetical protein